MCFPNIVWPPWTDGFYSNWAMVLITVLAVIAALKTLGIIREQTDYIKGQLAEMKTASEIANKSAAASLDSARAAFNAERPWVEVELVAPTTQIDSQTGEEIVCAPDQNEFNSFGRYGISVTNHGRTVARIIDYKIWHDTNFAGPFEPDKFSTFTQETRHLLLAANRSTVIANFDLDDCFKDWTSIQDGKTTAMMRFDIRYEDIIRGEVKGSPFESHITTTIYYYVVRDEELRRLPQYNVYT